jgi:hypothetical protein
MYFLEPFNPTARPIMSARRHKNATRITMSRVRRLRPRYLLCGGSMRSKRSDSAHLAPSPAPPNFFGLGPSSGVSQLVSATLAVSTSFKCACVGGPTSFRGIVNALMLECTVARRVASKIVYTEVSRELYYSIVYVAKGVDAGAIVCSAIWTSSKPGVEEWRSERGLGGSTVDGPTREKSERADVQAWFRGRAAITIPSYKLNVARTRPLCSMGVFTA